MYEYPTWNHGVPRKFCTSYEFPSLYLIIEFPSILTQFPFVWKPVLWRFLKKPDKKHVSSAFLGFPLPFALLSWAYFFSQHRGFLPFQNLWWGLIMFIKGARTSWGVCHPPDDVISLVAGSAFTKNTNIWSKKIRFFGPHLHVDLFAPFYSRAASLFRRKKHQEKSGIWNDLCLSPESSVVHHAPVPRHGPGRGGQEGRTEPRHVALSSLRAPSSFRRQVPCAGFACVLTPVCPIPESNSNSSVHLDLCFCLSLQIHFTLKSFASSPFAFRGFASST